MRRNLRIFPAPEKAWFGSVHPLVCLAQRLPPCRFAAAELLLKRRLDR